MKTFSGDIYSLSSKRQYTLFASNGFQKERIEHHAGDTAAYLPFHWIGFICVYGLRIHKGFNPWDKGNKSDWAAFEMDGKIERFFGESGHAVCFRSRI